MIRINIAPVVAFALALAGSPVAAETAPAVHVAYADLDLSSPNGMATLQHRVSGAINEVCGQISPMDLHAMQLGERCRKAARADAATRVAMAVQEQQLARAATINQIASR
jgi:UrcA family protein